MKRLEVRHFKCFEDSVSFDLPNDSNLLLCGENGAGKSSLFEAIKLAYYKEKMLPGGVAIAGPAANAGQANTGSRYNNGKYPQKSFEILVDGIGYAQYNSTDTEVFLISCDDLKRHDAISLNSIFSNLFFPDTVLGQIKTYWSNEFLQFVNDSLKDDFYEKVKLELLQGLDYSFKITDELQNVHAFNDLGKTFNEAKLNIVILVILFQMILLTPSDKKRILVLDDIINSLDVANRGLVAKFIMTHFKDYQILLFTHNVSFYNLFSYAVSNYKFGETWQKRILYEVNGTRVLVKDETPETVSCIKKNFLENPKNCESIGNRIRKLFEYLLHEYARLMQFGDFMDTSSIINRISNSNSQRIFLRICGDKTYSVEDMILSIKGIVETAPKELIREKIKKKFEDFDSTDFFKQLIPVVQDLTLFQKLTLHQLSHTQNGLSVFSTQEIEYSLYLLDKMEKTVAGLKTMNTTGNIYNV